MTVHGFQRTRLVPEWRREALRTNLWLVPALEVTAALALFAVTYGLDRAAADGTISLPDWVNNGSADAARQTLIAIAAAVITVIGLVFSITIVALTLASTQFGPRMLRNFIRDRGTQLTLGTFVATFVFAVLALASVSSGAGSDFVPHLSVTVALVLVLVDVGVLVYFIDHVAKSIQLPNVIAGIAADLARAVQAETDDHAAHRVVGSPVGPSPDALTERLDREGATIRASSSGYLQFIAYPALVELAADADATVRMLHRPGHFVVEGLPLAEVWPPSAAARIDAELEAAHATGSHRTLSQDLAFAIDQLVEIAIRALSPAVNDTFTALTCIDWLADALCKISANWEPTRMYRDRSGQVRVIATMPSIEWLVDRSFDKIRQAGQAMPAVLIRQLDALTKICEYASDSTQLVTLSRQADMLLRSATKHVDEPFDKEDVRERHRRFTGGRRDAEARLVARAQARAT